MLGQHSEAAVKINLPGEVLQRIDKMRRGNRLSRSAFIRELVYRELGIKPPPAVRRTTGAIPDYILQAALQSGRLTPAQKTAAELRLQGYSYSNIIRELDRRGISTRSGKPWSRQTVALLLDQAGRIGLNTLGVLR